MSDSSEQAGPVYRVAILSLVKHDYVARGIVSHPRFQAVVVADDPQQPDWVHARNVQFAQEWSIPYVQHVEDAIRQYDAQVAVVSPEANRHVDLSVRAANCGLHVVQDKPLSPNLEECDRLVAAVERAGTRFLMWNRNYMPAVDQAIQRVRSGEIGKLRAVHIDFYFAKDAGPPLGSRPPQEPPLDWLTYLREAHATGADGGVGPVALGELQVEGIYPLAHLQALTGASVVQVFARTTTHFHQLHADHQVDDLATLSLRMSDGTVGTICVGRIGNASHPDLGQIRLHLLGTEGGLVIREPVPEIAVDYRGRPETTFRHQRLCVDNDWRLAEHFAQSIDHQRETMLDARASRAIARVVAAALESARSGRAIDVRS